MGKIVGFSLIVALAYCEASSVEKQRNLITSPLLQLNTINKSSQIDASIEFDQETFDNSFTNLQYTN